MGIFKLFRKKTARDESQDSDKAASQKNRAKGQSTVTGQVQDDEALTHSITEKKHIARATERKIDAIEFEMSRDMGRPKSLPNKSPANDPVKPPETNQFHSDFVAPDFQSTIALSAQASELLTGHTELHAGSLSQSESIPLLEEAAILFATGQVKVAEHMLKSAIEQDNLGHAAPLAWFMLFDLYQIEQNQYAFESLSLDYAGKYETSPPVWRNTDAPKIDEGKPATAVTPNVSFPAQLDGDIIKVLQKINNLSALNKVLKLDFARVKGVDPVGCGLLLRGMRKLKKTKHDLIVVGAQNLTEQIRAILEVGRRDETEAPWLLLMEMLQLLALKEAFEEASIDYCVTFEVSPPAYEAPTSKVTTAIADQESAQVDAESDRFVMPKEIKGSTDKLVGDISTHALDHEVIILDCNLLERVEFGASAELLNGLVPISASKGKSIQFHEVNYLVMHLFNAMGLKSVAAIFPRKQS